MDPFVIALSAALVIVVLILLLVLSKRVPIHKYHTAREQLAQEQERTSQLMLTQQKLQNEIDTSRTRSREQEDLMRSSLQHKSAIESKLELLEVHLKKEERTNEIQGVEIKQQHEDLVAFRETIAQLQSVNEALNEKLEKQEENLKKQSENLIQVFKNEAQRAFEEKSQKFSEENKINIQTILKPLNDKIKDFQHRVEETHKDTIDRHASLREQILNLRDLNESMTKEAQQLTKALKGDSKIQGNWGEVVLQRVLEKSGLEKGREYEIQQSFQTEEGRKQPDVIIYLPDGKKLIVDSKVSLTGYEKMINAEEEEFDTYLKAHLLSIKNHVDQLSEKRYHDIYQIESPDFVLMFIPIETAFSSAVNADHEIYQRAFDKNIVIVTPATLLATLKTIDSMWTNEKQKRNSIEIATEAGKMYDKLVLLLEDLKRIGAQMDTTKKSYSAAMNKLYEGSGNMIKRAEKLKKLGAKASKSIDQKWIERAGEPNEE